MLAAANKHVDVVRTLLLPELHANMNLSDKVRVQFSLTSKPYMLHKYHPPCCHGPFQVLALLLIVAAQCGSSEVASLLLDHEASVDYCDTVCCRCI